MHTKNKGFLRNTRNLYFHIQKAILFSLTLGFIFAGIIILWLSTLQIPDLKTFSDRQIVQSTKIYDRTGEVLLYDIHENAKRTVVPLSEISTHIRNATIAIEDAEFYEHFGIKPKAIVRAVLANLIPGGLTQGGSTITQQIIKNSVLTKDKTITRKLKEWVLAVKLERDVTKDEILAIYLNETTYGGSIFGVEEAARNFFGKQAKDVTLAEAAYIAALPQAPSFYSPYGKNIDRLDARQRLVLSKMYEYGFISKEERDIAVAEQVTFKERGSTSIKAPHFSMYVRDYLTQKYGEDTVESGGLRVITTLDFNLQTIAEEKVTEFAPGLAQNFNASNTAMVAIDPKTGDILTMVGSRNYFDTEIEGNFNIATAKRQPGSTFKPFVYAAGLEKGYTPETILFDVKTEFSSECTPDSKPKIKDSTTIKCYNPENYDLLYEGPITMRRALAQSRNIPAVKMLYLVGIPTAIDLAEKMGIESLNDPDRYGLTLTLGGGEVSLLELTSAYGVFANDGLRNPHRAILRVEDSEGNILEQAQNNPVQVLDANVARDISDILTDKTVRSSSVAQIVNPIGRSIAAKTGTTNDYRDVWIMGYTPNLVVGAWAGKNDNTPMERKVAGLIITPLWGAFLNEALKTLPREEFKTNDTIVDPRTIKPVMRSIWLGGESYFIDSVSKKLATELTPQETLQEVTIPGVHSILHWVDKRDPLGAIPEEPQKDSQYENWEYGVQKWFEDWKKKNPSFKETVAVAPTEKDDVHTPENSPKVAFKIDIDARLAPKKAFPLEIQTSSKYPIRKVEYFLNGRIIGTSQQSPYSITFTPTKDEVFAKNEIGVVVTDSVFNRTEARITIDGTQRE
jgi:1A family penicillin-binding protein